MSGVCASCPASPINAYGGMVWEMDHPFNLATWLRQHPRAGRRDGAAARLPDPGTSTSRSTFRVATTAPPAAPPGPRISNGWRRASPGWRRRARSAGSTSRPATTASAAATCCAAAARGAGGCAAPARLRRILVARRHGRFLPAALRGRALPATRSLGLLRDPMGQPARPRGATSRSRNLPGEAIYQHTFNRPYWERVQRELTPEYAQQLPTKTNVFRCQFASQWNGDRRTERYFFNGRDFDGDGQEGRGDRLPGLDRLGRDVSLRRRHRAELPRLRPVLLGSDADLGAVPGRRRCTLASAAPTPPSGSWS